MLHIISSSEATEIKESFLKRTTKNFILKFLVIIALEKA